MFPNSVLSKNNSFTLASELIHLCLLWALILYLCLLISFLLRLLTIWQEKMATKWSRLLGLKSPLHIFGDRVETGNILARIGSKTVPNNRGANMYKCLRVSLYICVVHSKTTCRILKNKHITTVFIRVQESGACSSANDSSAKSRAVWGQLMCLGIVISKFEIK